MSTYQMKKIISFALILSFFSISVWASKASLQQIETQYKNLKSWQATFEQTSYIEVLDQNLSKQGRIFAVRPDKIRIEYESTPKKTYITNGKKLWVYQNATNSAEEFHNPETLISKEALSFLSGLSRLSENFTLIENLKEAKGFFKITDKTLKKVGLIPKGPSNILRLTLGIDPDTLKLREAVLYNSSGNVTHYKFSKVEFDKVDLSRVKFNIDKGVKVTKHK